MKKVAFMPLPFLRQDWTMKRQKIRNEEGLTLIVISIWFR